MIHNYITNLPNFMTMQRTSFCWFIAQGILEELNSHLCLFDFTKNVQYILFPEEYKFFVLNLNLRNTRKFAGNYNTELSMPIEIRDKMNNTIYFNKKFSLLTLPLMTDLGTFYLNGCERLIVSQIIRCPGIYFEKLKNQKKRKLFKRKLSSDISKLRSFLPSGEAFINESELFFATPISKYNRKLKKYQVSPYWKHESLYSYSLSHLKQQTLDFAIEFFQFFQFYRLLTSHVQDKKKQQFIKLFIKWLKIDFNHSKLESKQLVILLSYYLWLNKIIYKSIILESFNSIKITNRNNLTIAINSKILLQQKLLNFKTLSQFENKFQNFTTTNYLSLVYSSFLLLNKRLGSELFLVNNSIYCLNKFNILRKRKNQIQNNLQFYKFLKNSKHIFPTISFLNTLKYQLIYLFKKKSRINFNPIWHKYTKSKTRFILFNEDHSIKTFYNKKYSKKDYYQAILIPYYGSWIRFGFQKNINLNQYSYPIKNVEEKIILQIDKLAEIPIVDLLKEIGLTDLDIYKNLEHNDFFYFTKPILYRSKDYKQLLTRFNVVSENRNLTSKFVKIFNPTEYKLNKIGRLHINRRLKINISPRIQAITYEDILAITDTLIKSTISKNLPDDIDHLKNKRIRSVGEILQSLIALGYQRLIRRLENQTTQIDPSHFGYFSLINSTIKEFFGSSQLSQYLDQTNSLSSLTHRRRISGLGPGGFDRERISFSVRDIHPSHYGRICPIETPEGQNVGLIASLTTSARINNSGFLETPFWRVINGKVIKSGIPIYLTADIEDFYKIAPADLITTSNNYLVANFIPIRLNQEFLNVAPWEVDFISVSPIQSVSVAASLIPFFEHDDANRALMGSNMQRQSVPLIFSQKPIVGTGLEYQIAIDSGMLISNQKLGIVDSVIGNRIIITDSHGMKKKYFLDKYIRSNQQTCINQRPCVWKGETIKSGERLSDGPSINDNELALGQNLLVSYMPWQGYNFEDAILINERLVYENILSSIHIERYKIELDYTSEILEELTSDIPELNYSDIEHLHKNGIIKIGTYVKSGDILVGKVILNDNSELLPESRLLRAIFGAKSKGTKDSSYRLPKRDHGRVIETVIFNKKRRKKFIIEKIHIYIAQIRKIQVGDKIAGRHGNKGIISRILAKQDMPFLPDGTPIDIILNPLGVPSRMNVGQLYECLLGLAGDKMNCRFKILPFDEMFGNDISRILINKKLRQASIANNQSWLFNPYIAGKIILIDGRTGKEFDNPITVGNAYILKLIHLVDDKMHARATGPYSLITQQPLRGKAQNGGQRFGEMEVWALEGFGAAFTLKELLTIKSDDMDGRNETLNCIVRDQQFPECGIPESFKVLLQELRAIGLNMATYQIRQFHSKISYDIEINIIEKYKSLLKTFSITSDFNDITF